jgi:nitroimidazol reductase NimA-like FMN-containing flavoprotein (pyridoxamine 5'-phosphate oxidase superfamily)
MNTLPSEVQNFLTSNNIATLATLSDKNDYPYVLPVFYIIDKNFHLYFASRKDTRKIQNILFHPHIGISITDSLNLISLQLHGTAKITKSTPEMVEKIVLTFTIEWFQLANYSGKDAVLVEGKMES